LSRRDATSKDSAEKGSDPPRTDSSLELTLEETDIMTLSKMLAGKALTSVASISLSLQTVQAQHGSPDGVTYDPGSEFWAESVATEYAMYTGNDGLVVAIGNGSINVYVGNPGNGAEGASLVPADGASP